MSVSTSINVSPHPAGFTMHPPIDTAYEPGCRQCMDTEGVRDRGKPSIKSGTQRQRPSSSCQPPQSVLRVILNKLHSIRSTQSTCNKVFVRRPIPESRPLATRQHVSRLGLEMPAIQHGMTSYIQSWTPIFRSPPLVASLCREDNLNRPPRPDRDQIRANSIELDKNKHPASAARFRCKLVQLASYFPLVSFLTTDTSAHR